MTTRAHKVIDHLLLTQGHARTLKALRTAGRRLGYPGSMLTDRALNRRIAAGERNFGLREARVQWLADGDVTRDQLVRLYLDSSARCAFCGETVEARLTPSNPAGFDHIVARANGGRHTISNLQVCCRACNTKKGIRTSPG